jgi:hypothetical protein
MSQEMKTKILKSKVVDLKGMTIPKGTRIYIIGEFDMKHYRTHKNEHFTKCLIDNGTNEKKLMPETVFKGKVKA